MHRFINPLLLWLAHASHADLSVSVGQSAAIGVGPGVATTRRATGLPRAAGRAPAALWVAGGGVSSARILLSEVVCGVYVQEGGDKPRPLSRPLYPRRFSHRRVDSSGKQPFLIAPDGDWPTLPTFCN